MKRSIVIPVAITLALGSLIAAAFRPSVYAPYAEGKVYVDLARGASSQIPSLYSGRLAHPLMVRMIARIANVPIDAHVFFWVSAASLIAFLVFLGAYYGLEYSAAGSIWICLLVTATVVDQYRNYYWHDLFYVALSALFFLLLRVKPWVSPLILLLLYLTRESTIVLVVSLLAVSAIGRRWKLSLASAGVGAVGLTADFLLAARALPSKHGFSLFKLDILKIPYNFAYNICGLVFWTNTDVSTLPPPVWKAHVPLWLHLGNIRQIGYCGFFWQNPVRTFLVLATAFGVLPLAIVRVAKSRKWVIPWPERLDIATALVFGTLMFVLTPLVGTLPARYVLYAWPLFWIFGVALLHRAFPNWKTRAYIIVVSACISWTPAVVRLFLGPPVSGPESISTLNANGLLPSLAIVLALNAIAWPLLATGKPAGVPALQLAGSHYREGSDYFVANRQIAGTANSKEFRSGSRK